MVEAMWATGCAFHRHCLVVGAVEFTFGGVGAVLWHILQGRGAVGILVSYRMGVSTHPGGVWGSTVSWRSGLGGSVRG
jgi:hypothetical protein